MLNAIWYSCKQDCVGIVRLKNNFGEIYYRIGTGKGENEKEDMKNIAFYGAKFSTKVGKVLFGDN